MGLITHLYTSVLEAVARRPGLVLAVCAALSVSHVLLLTSKGSGAPSAPRFKRKEAADDEDGEEEEGLVGGNDQKKQQAQHEEAPHVPYKQLYKFPEDVMIKRSEEFYSIMNARRSCRFFSNKDVPLEVIENIIRVGGTAPSGAHTEPWTFSVVRNPAVKQQVREVIEAEEKINYERRMGQQWVDDLQAVGTTWEKPYLTEAPYLIIVQKQTYGVNEDGTRKVHYYHEISTSIAVGMVLAAVQYAGLVSVTTTPLNAGPALRQILNRPSNEKVMVLLPVGYPAEDATVPNFSRKPLQQIMDLH